MNRALRLKRKSAVSSVVGGLFVLVIMILGLVAVIYISGLENNVHSAENSAALLDSNRNQEKLKVLGASFDGSQVYLPSQQYVSSCAGSCGITMNAGNAMRYGGTLWCASTSTCGSNNYTRGTLEPGFAPLNITSQTATGSQQLLSNMNFSENVAGWSSYSSSSQVVGGFTSSQGNVEGSGPGAMYAGSQFVSGSTASENQSTEFYLDPTSTGTGTITGATFSFAEYFSENEFSSAKLSSYTYNVYLVDLTSGTNYLMWSSGVVSSRFNADLQWNYMTGVTSFNAGGRNGFGAAISTAFIHKGYYDVVVQTILKFQTGSCGVGCIQFFGYFDDVGLSIQYSSFVTDWSYSFNIGQPRADVNSLSLSVTTSYNQSNVNQYLYVYDWALNQYYLYSESVSSSESTTISIIVNATDQSNPQNLVSSGGIVILRIYSERPSAPSTGAVGNEMGVDISSSNGLSATVFYPSQSSFTLILQNDGPQPIEIVSLVIVDSNGHTFINASGATLYNGTFTGTMKFDKIIYPEQTVNAKVPYSWTSGEISLSLLTSLGNEFSFTTIAM